MPTGLTRRWWWHSRSCKLRASINNSEHLLISYYRSIGLQICNVFTTPISSGIDTIFVASAWEPQALMQNHPDLYNAMVQVYPQVQVAIHA